MHVYWWRNDRWKCRPTALAIWLFIHTFHSNRWTFHNLQDGTPHVLHESTHTGPHPKVNFTRRKCLLPTIHAVTWFSHQVSAFCKHLDPTPEVNKNNTARATTVNKFLVVNWRPKLTWEKTEFNSHLYLSHLLHDPTYLFITMLISKVMRKKIFKNQNL